MKPKTVTAKEIVDYLGKVEGWFTDLSTSNLALSQINSRARFLARDVAKKRIEIEDSILSASKIK